ncbi:hypothetical protein AYI74_04215 [Shewanella algae]|nr:hypothetical protein AYI88_08150 [Shewanella algae]TWU69636.1 hypothetical protein AYI74_04215 [Shewanella algae]
MIYYLEQLFRANGDLNIKKRYTEEQIIKAIKQHEAGAKVDDILWKACLNNNFPIPLYFNCHVRSDSVMNFP